MATNTIAADYENVKATLRAMDQNIQSMNSSVKELQSAVGSIQQWKGVDSEAYKSVLSKYENKISNSLNWLQNLDKIIFQHADRLYERALEDQKAEEFR